MRLTTKRAAVRSIVVAVIPLAMAIIAEAQQPEKTRWIGYLTGSGSSPNQAFVQGLRELGYVEGKNIAFVFRTAEGNPERYADLAAELVRLKVDIIVADFTPPAVAAKKATSTIPIVMTTVTDPIGTGLVASLARPGGNVTGLTNISGELGGKQLELLKEIVPKLNRVAILRTVTSGRVSADDVFVKETEVPARALGVQLVPVKIQGSDDLEDAFRAMTKERTNGLVVRLLAYIPFKRVADLTIQNRLPSIAQQLTWADAGGLMSYGAELNVQYRRAATYVDKILKGAKPADLPVEAPTKFELRINLKTAKQIGANIPQSVLYRADKVIR